MTGRQIISAWFIFVCSVALSAVGAVVFNLTFDLAVAATGLAIACVLLARDVGR